MKKRSIVKARLVYFITASFFIISPFQNTYAFFKEDGGIIEGTVYDEKSGETLTGASVIIPGTNTGTETDADGHFRIINLNPGKYNLRINYQGYTTKDTLGIVLKRREVKVLIIKLSQADIELNRINITARRNLESENTLIANQKQSVAAVQAMGAHELSRKGISNAENAVSEIAGISKQEGIKNVFIRGLGDRYNSTTFNGFPIPSEDPEYKNISLSFFTSDIIKAISVNKAFTSDMSSDVSGASINILSRELQKKKEFSIAASAGFNTSVPGNDILISDGVNIFGFANYKMPVAGEDGKSVPKVKFHNSLDPQKSSLPLNHKFDFTFGKKFTAGKNMNPLSFYLVGSYNRDFYYNKSKLMEFNTAGNIRQDQDCKISTANTSHVLLGNLNYGFKRNYISYNILAIHKNTQSVKDYYGRNTRAFEDATENDYKGFLRRQQTNDNLLIVNQINSEWVFNDKSSLTAGIDYNYVRGSEPDRRENYFSNLQDNYFIFTEGDMSDRNFSLLKENDYNARAAFKIKLPDNAGGKSEAYIGYAGRYKKDDFEADDFSYENVHLGQLSTDPRKDPTGLDLDNYYSQKNADGGFFEVNKYYDLYNVSKQVHSFYLRTVYAFGKKFTADLGFKTDITNIKIDYNVNRGGSKGSDKINKTYLLPGVNLKYDLSGRHTLRLSLSKTYTLPQSKEISPFMYRDVSFTSAGNADLKTSENYNADLKWDYYMDRGELLTLTAFYKYIKDPISRVDEGNAARVLTYDNASDKAIVAGGELVLKKTLAGKSNIRRGGSLTAGFNAAYTYTHTDITINGANENTGSNLEGASPVILNFDLSYKYTGEKCSFTNTLVFNYFSDRVYLVGLQGYHDTMEKGCPTLDFVSINKPGKHLTLTFKAKNLLNSKHELTRKVDTENGTEPRTLSDVRKGINLSVGVAYSF
ncbi:MAG: TonB-dependent receptor [Bacteroidales bacterium]|jgi:outer membrane receptor protein involved in Fe transport|nr:TonB-dependent receptor [Bacteroidales bacterium]